MLSIVIENTAEHDLIVGESFLFLELASETNEIYKVYCEQSENDTTSFWPNLQI